MRCRNMVNGNVVWFGSTGLNQDGTAKFENDAHSSFVDKSESVATSLEQRLSVLRTELWFDVTHGIPLFDKVKSKAIIDISVMEIVKKHPEVMDIVQFSSTMLSKHYSCSFKVITIYGLLALTI